MPRVHCRPKQTRVKIAAPTTKSPAATSAGRERVWMRPRPRTKGSLRRRGGGGESAGASSSAGESLEAPYRRVREPARKEEAEVQPAVVRPPSDSGMCASASGVSSSSGDNRDRCLARCSVAGETGGDRRALPLWAFLLASTLLDAQLDAHPQGREMRGWVCMGGGRGAGGVSRKRCFSRRARWAKDMLNQD